MCGPALAQDGSLTLEELVTLKRLGSEDAELLRLALARGLARRGPPSPEALAALRAAGAEEAS